MEILKNWRHVTFDNLALKTNSDGYVHLKIYELHDEIKQRPTINGITHAPHDSLIIFSSVTNGHWQYS